MKKMKPQELENRLIDFAVAVVEVTEALPNTKAGKRMVAGEVQSPGIWIYREGAKVAEGRGER